MILVATSDIAQMTDAILWASVEFGIQCEAYLRKVYDRDRIDILDLSEIAGIGGEMMWVVGHGYPAGAGVHIEVQDTSLSWTDFGALIEPHIPNTMKDIYLTSCFAAAGPTGDTGLHKIWKKISHKAGSVKVHGYIGPVVSNIVTGPIKVVDDQSHALPTLVNAQEGVATKIARNQKLRSWKMSNPGASRSKTAEAAAEVNWDFYRDFTTVFGGNSYFYGPLTDGAREVVVP